MRLALHLRLAIPALLICMLLSGKPFDLIHVPALALMILAGATAFGLSRYRQRIETFYWIGVPFLCGAGAMLGSSFRIVGEILAFGLCSSVYGLVWFGLDSESKDPAWRRWTTAVPVFALAGLYFPLENGGPGLGSQWVMLVALATGIVGFAGAWRYSAPPTSIWSFAAAVTLCLGVHAFQNLERASALDVALMFGPYATGILTTLVSRNDPLLQDSAHAKPVREQLRPLG